MANIPKIKAHLIIAEAVEVSEKKLYMLGGALTRFPADPPSHMAIAAHVTFSAEMSEHTVGWQIRLCHEDGKVVRAGDPALPISGGADMKLGKPERDGMPIHLLLAIKANDVPFEPLKIYYWALRIDGREYARAYFCTVEATNPVI